MSVIIDKNKVILKIPNLSTLKQLDSPLFCLEEFSEVSFIQRKPESKTTSNMAYSNGLFLVSSIFVAVLFTVTVTVDAGGDFSQLNWAPEATCHGTIAECIAGREEFDMDTEINRRILATTKYISYGALQRNTVPCSQRGASYYNCRPGAEANPYNRGCSTITRCRS